MVTAESRPRAVNHCCSGWSPLCNCALLSSIASPSSFDSQRSSMSMSPLVIGSETLTLASARLSSMSSCPLGRRFLVSHQMPSATSARTAKAIKGMAIFPQTKGSAEPGKRVILPRGMPPGCYVIAARPGRLHAYGAAFFATPWKAGFPVWP